MPVRTDGLLSRGGAAGTGLSADAPHAGARNQLFGASATSSFAPSSALSRTRCRTASASTRATAGATLSPACPPRTRATASLARTATRSRPSSSRRCRRFQSPSPRRATPTIRGSAATRTGRSDPRHPARGSGASSLPPLLLVLPGSHLTRYSATDAHTGSRAGSTTARAPTRTAAGTTAPLARSRTATATLFRAARRSRPSTRSPSALGRCARPFRREAKAASTPAPTRPRTRSPRTGARAARRAAWLARRLASEGLASRRARQRRCAASLGAMVRGKLTRSASVGASGRRSGARAIRTTSRWGSAKMSTSLSMLASVQRIAFANDVESKRERARAHGAGRERGHYKDH